MRSSLLLIASVLAILLLAIQASQISVSKNSKQLINNSLQSYNVNASLITVSGVSSGGYMAGQVHVAFSKLVKGAAFFAAGPYFCANSNIEFALVNCMRVPQLIVLKELTFATDEFATLGYIDAPANMKNQKIWIFTGAKDTVVATGVVSKLKEYYDHYQANVTYISTVPAEHSWVSPKGTSACDYMGSPYVNNCNKVDYPGQLLQNMYDGDFKLKNKTQTYVEANLFQFDQTEFIAGSPADASLDTVGYVYVPTGCQNKKKACALHVSFHGCWQSRTDVQEAFVKTSGLNEWAETNHIIVVYPQAQPNSLKMNPRGCWDWWGYTSPFSPSYATKNGVQMKMFKNIVDRIMGQH